MNSKWFQDSIGHVGLNKMLDGFDDRSAYALCTFAYCEGPGHEPIIFEGKTHVIWKKGGDYAKKKKKNLIYTHKQGKIVTARGPGVFGWDAIFLPDGFDQT